MWRLTVTTRLSLKTLLVLLLSFTAWIQPIKAASALIAEPQEEAVQFINYQAIRDSNNQRKSESSQNTSSRKLGIAQSIPPTSAGVYNGRHYNQSEVIQLIEDYSRTYRIESAAPLCVAKLESGYNQFSKNKSSSASGVFQYLSGTWKATDEGKAGLSVFDADANVRAAIKYMASRKSLTPWVVGSRCPQVKTIN